MLPELHFPSFEPHPLLGGAHVMTLASLLPRWVFDAEPRLPAAEQRLFGVDEHTQLRGWCHWQAGVEAPTLLLVHGHSGDADSSYMLGTSARALVAGFHVVRLNMRNCGGTEHLTPTLYSALQTEDLLSVAGHLVAGRANARLYIVGFSMGGNMSLKLAGELADDAPSWLRGVAAVSPPIELAAGQAALDGDPRNRIYREYFLRDMRLLVKRKAALYPELYDLDALEGIKTIHDWDENITAPHFGFDDAPAYYRAASSRELLARIRVPTLIVHARDDPIVPFVPLADPAVLHPASTLLLSTDHGGHCAFISRIAEGSLDRYWAESRVIDFLSALERESRNPAR